MTAGTARQSRLRHPSWAWAVAVALAVLASLVGTGSVSQASAPAVATSSSASDGVLGAWVPLGVLHPDPLIGPQQGPGLNNTVYSLAEYDGYLYAGGYFDGPGWDSGLDFSDCTDNFDATTSPLNCIARFPLDAATTSPWEPVDGGLNGQVDDMVVMDGDLYVGGKFDDVAGQGDRNCSTQDDSALNCLATFDGTAWAALAGGGVSNFEYPPVEVATSTLAATTSGYVDASSTRMVGGTFSGVGPTVAGIKVRLSADSSTTITSPTTGITASIYSADASTSLPTGPARVSAPMTLSWDATYTYLDATFPYPPYSASDATYTFALSTDATSTSVFRMAYSTTSYPDVALLTKSSDATTWQRDASKTPLFEVRASNTPDVHRLAAMGDDETLVVAGGFQQAGTVGPEFPGGLPGLAAWSRADATFTAPGTGGFQNSVEALLAEGTSTLYVGGGFQGDYNPSTNPMGVWNGIGVAEGPFDVEASWEPMGQGFSWYNTAVDNTGYESGRVDALAMVDGTLYAGGAFRWLGPPRGWDDTIPPSPVEFENLAAWNGTVWEPVGPGLNYDATATPATSVRSLAADASRGLLYVGGTFTDVSSGDSTATDCDRGGNLRCITVWDTGVNEFIPFQWGTDPEENGLSGEVLDFVVRGADVYAAGKFNTWAEAGFPLDWTLKNVGKWTWEPPTGTVSTSASSGGSVAITGEGFIGVRSTGGVKFGSTPVSYTRSSSTSITATVPCGLGSGNYTITVDGVGGWGSVGTVNVTERACSSPPAPAPTPTIAPTSSASPSPTPTPTVTGPTTQELQEVGLVRPGRIPALARGVPPGKAIVIVDGRPQRNNLTVWQQGMTVRTGPLTMAVRTQSASGATQAPVDGSLSIPQSRAPVRGRSVAASSVALTTSGNAALTPLRVYLIPQPKTGPRGARVVDLGYLMTDAQGRLQGKVELRARRTGAYILQVNGLGSDGLVRSINLPAIVRR